MLIHIEVQGYPDADFEERMFIYYYCIFDMSSMVTRQLKRRIGTMSPELEQQIDQLSFEQLGELGEALLDFKDEAALKNWLATH